MRFYFRDKVSRICARCSISLEGALQRGSVSSRHRRRTGLRKNAEVLAGTKKQTGGHGQFGDCIRQVKPLPRGEDFSSLIRSPAAIPRQWIPAVEAALN